MKVFNNIVKSGVEFITLKYDEQRQLDIQGIQYQTKFVLLEMQPGSSLDVTFVGDMSALWLIFSFSSGPTNVRISVNGVNINPQNDELNSLNRIRVVDAGVDQIYYSEKGVLQA